MPHKSSRTVRRSRDYARLEFDGRLPFLEDVSAAENGSTHWGEDLHTNTRNDKAAKPACASRWGTHRVYHALLQMMATTDAGTSRGGFNIRANHKTCIPPYGPFSDEEEETMAWQVLPLFLSHITLTRSTGVKISPYYAGAGSPELSQSPENPAKKTLLF